MITRVKLVTTDTSLTNPYTSKLIHGLGLALPFSNLFLLLHSYRLISLEQFRAKKWFSLPPFGPFGSFHVCTSRVCNISDTQPSHQDLTSSNKKGVRKYFWNSRIYSVELGDAIFCNLCNHTTRTSFHTASNYIGRHWMLNYKECGRKWSWPTSRYYSDSAWREL
jgi:hypothetical protein